MGLYESIPIQSFSGNFIYNKLFYLYKILKKYEGLKGIVHTNSFELSNWMKRDIEDSIRDTIECG